MVLSKEVIGFFPGWLNPDIYLDLNYDSLTTIAWAALAINTDGSLIKPAGYPPINLINYAHSKGKQVVVSINPGWGSSIIDNILSSASLQNTVINNILSEVKTNGFDGIDIDFEGFPATNSVSGGYNKSLFTSFIINISNKFRNANPNYRLSIDLPPIDWNNVFDTYTLKDYVDYLLIMGYDYHWQTGPTAGAVAPLTSPNNQSVTDSVNTYLQSTPANQLLLGVPYYGYEWQTQDYKPDSPTIGGAISIMYSQALVKIQQYTRQWSSTWSCPYYTYRASGQWYQGWYDDVQSLSLKYDLVNQKNLAGIGIWALGYDTPNPELANLIINKFYTNITPPLPTYNCTNNHCVKAPSGTTGIYQDLPSCQTLCTTPPPAGAGWNCSGTPNYNCFQVSSGAQYSTQSQCQTVCKASGGGTPGYSCINGNCQYVLTGAQYSTLLACQPVCVPPISTYSCINNTCIQASCTSGSPNCYTTNDCNNSCIAPPQRIQCSPNDIDIAGTCIPKNVYVIGSIALIAALLLTWR